MFPALLCSLLLLSDLDHGASLVFKPEVILQVPAEDVAVLEDPVDVTYDNKGLLYILDSSGKCLLVWDSVGRFVGSVGREGDGPGEFRFEDNARSELTFNGEYIVVWDDKAGKIQYFKDMKHVKTRNKPAGLGSVPFFECLQNGNAVMWQQQTRSRMLYSRIVLVDADSLQEIKVLSETVDEMYKRNEKGGWDFYPYSKRPIIHADYFSSRIWVGNAVDQDVAVFHMDGQLLERVRLTLPPREHTPADRTHVMRHYTWLKPPNKAVFANHKRLYNTIVPITANSALISPYNGDEGFYNGYVYEEKGKVLGRFKQFFGEQGGIFYTNHRIIAFYNDESGNYSIKTLRATFQ